MENGMKKKDRSKAINARAHEIAENEDQNTNLTRQFCREGQPEDLKTTVALRLDVIRREPDGLRLIDPLFQSWTIPELMHTIETTLVHIKASKS